MVERLRAIISTLETLPPDQQEQAATEFESWLADRNWDGWLKGVEGGHFLDELVHDFEREKQAGTIEEHGWGE